MENELGANEVLCEVVVPREFLRCPLCREEYQDPKFLPCLHSFCKACIDDYIESGGQSNDTALITPFNSNPVSPPLKPTTTNIGQRTVQNGKTSGKNVLVCPVCFSEITSHSTEATENQHSSPSNPGVTETSEDHGIHLVDNAFARRLSCPSIVLDSKQERVHYCQQRCRIAGLNTEASRYCINCDEFMCIQCSMEHLSEDETASHNTQSIEEYSSTMVDENQETNLSECISIPQCCRFYDALDIGTMYCVDCEIATCNECHSKDHVGHRCAELSAIADNFETKIREPLAQLRKDEHKLKREMSYLDKCKLYMVKKQQKIKALAKERSKTLWNFIQEYENMLNMEIDKIHTQNMAVLQNKHDSLQRCVASIHAVTDLTDKLILFGSTEEKVSMRRQIGRRVRELCEEELPTGGVELNKCTLSEPSVAVESICEMFGELVTEKASTSIVSSGKRRSNKSKTPLSSSKSIDLGSLGKGVTSYHSSKRHSVSVSSTEDHPNELADLEEYDEEADNDSDILSLSNSSDVLRLETRRLSTSSIEYSDFRTRRASSPRIGSFDKHKLLEVPNYPYSKHRNQNHNDSITSVSASDTSFQSSMNDVPCQNLEEPIKTIKLPDIILKDCIKGMGVTPVDGDIVVAMASPQEGNKVYILEKRGIIRGQLDLDKNFNIHSVATDGKVFTVLARSDNRYKIKVLTADNRTIIDLHVESFGINGLAATSVGTLLIASTRYPSTTPNIGRAPKLGGNVTIYDTNGTIQNILTNDTFAESLNMDLFDRPHCVAVDEMDNFFVADPGRHSVMGFRSDSSFLFEYGTTDAEEELYQGPDAVCTDKYQNVIVLDKKDSRIDILNYQGQLLRCYFPSQHVKYMSVTLDKMLALVDSEGEIRFYDYFV